MPQVPADKTFFTFVGGLNTEVSPLTFPEGTSLNEQNFTMLLNGTRRRRKGLARESGHALGSIDVESNYDTDMSVSSYRWTNVGGDPDQTFIVTQVGTSLLFAEEGEDLSPNFFSEYVDLTEFNTTAVDADITNYPLQFSSGRGYLFVSGRYIEPFYVSYDADTDTFTANRIQIWIRDFKGVDDGTDLKTLPVTTLTEDQRWNLLIRGWTSSLLNEFETAESVYPSKNMTYWRGYRRDISDATYADLDGIPDFDSAKLTATAFGDSSAPTGRLVQNPFATFMAKTADGSLVGVDTFSVASVGANWLVTLNTDAAHNIASPGDEFSIVNSEFSYLTTGGATAVGSLDGNYSAVTVPDTDTVTFYIYRPPTFASWVNQYVKKGQVGIDIATRSDSYSTYERPQAIAFHAGRVFWAGTAHSKLNDTVFFTQIIVGENQFGLCYQEADPTSEFINALSPSDGGTIVIPGMGQCYKMVQMEDVLILFCQNGIWAILPSSNGGFRADGYSVRKITDVECIGPQAVCKIDNTATFCSPRGIYVLVPDQNSGLLNATSISETTIQTLWNSIPDERKREVQVCYDDSKKRIFYLYGTSEVVAARTYNEAVVFDARISAFSKYTFPHSDEDTEWKIRGILATGLGDATDSAKKVKFLGTKDDGGAFLDVYDFDQEDFIDFDGGEQDAYILTGYDNLGDFARHRQAPVCHVYMHKTETGYEEAEDGALLPLGESSCWMQARWDWADHLNSGKWGTEQQVYRHVRYYQPTDVSDGFDSGLPVVVTRNKLRGRGRCLHLRFRADEGKDCYILGWAIHYMGESKQ